MGKPFVRLDAFYSDDAAAQNVLSFLNHLSDASWSNVKAQLPKSGLVAVDSIDTTTDGLLAEHLPHLVRLAPGTDPVHADLAVLANCMSGASMSGIFVYLGEHLSSAEVVARVTSILRASGAHKVECCRLNPDVGPPCAGES